ncbi:poly(ADP-ribose) glycohydrolase (macronuclear) [Tetrahymena thermophila SB210]|uniref:poly(ADP-ribose) glycohydrolase n=1 Tax=Tetrahymena thermophila (strain SB210) TaxID=312017 RepID=Q23CY6_TETTS|nr:poly(ADP-ribose) glycohydrolase [Tetrahymena thermophila SB210]EAR94344.1 poly(ADP-ribose) glycohydrolase [Tetrahymena thermophila SB210]|eukprot:XP_001014900.1 poly(ADP-ribose) glycohydrolase [Tetrahymena thermophila SB210]
MKIDLTCDLKEYCFISVCLNKILNSNYGLNESLFIQDLQILFNYQNFQSLKCITDLQNLREYIQNLDNAEKQFFLNDLIKFIAEQALKMTRFQNEDKKIKYLGANQQDKVSLTKEEVSILLANMFLLSTPRRMENNSLEQSLPKCCSKICYEFIFNISSGKAMKSKLRCIHNYFKRIYQRRHDQKYLNLVVEFQRIQYQNNSLRLDQDILLGEIQFEEDKKIEDFKDQNYIHVDFANKYIGGGSLYDGDVQEEILFNTCPEMLVSTIFCQKMEEKEAILIIGAERFNSYIGYGYDFQVTGEYFDKSSINKEKNYINTYVACIDAIAFLPQDTYYQQYEQKNIYRELFKSLAGFQGPLKEEKQNKYDKTPVVTGNWGCGIFNGDPQLKLLIQWISCSLLQKKMIYCSFKDRRLANQQQFIEGLKGKSIKSIFGLLDQYSITNKSQTLFSFLKSQKIN